jgi:hypothetical protein
MPLAFGSASVEFRIFYHENHILHEPEETTGSSVNAARVAAVDRSHADDARYALRGPSWAASQARQQQSAVCPRSSGTT